MLSDAALELPVLEIRDWRLGIFALCYDCNQLSSKEVYDGYSTGFS